MLKVLAGWVALLLLPFTLAGCGSTPPLIHQYVLEYYPPLPQASGQLDAALTVSRFAVAEPYNTTAMVYRPEPLKQEVYRLNRWRVNPGALVTDYLARDLRHSGLFLAVFTEKHQGPSRFCLEGGVEEIQELDEPDGWKAALTLTVTLLDLEEAEIPRQIIFQKTYRATEPMLSRTPEGLARAMSRAMQRLSRQITAEVYQAAKQRMGQISRKSSSLR
ncbi:MAG: membrane integrity-associated transporter subunit PqiC [Deltaproteobacteria bacterium]|nr:membrane integrity-associated transporter subunit PqiC [Deltaproteobacteria bacterium]